jgi:DNA repair protein RAD16
MQWKNEIASHTDGLKVLVWHGSARNSDVAELKKFDVVSIETFIGFLEGC